MSYKNISSVTGEQLPAKLVIELQQYKVLLSPLLLKLKETTELSTLFDFYPRQSQT